MLTIWIQWNSNQFDDKSWDPTDKLFESSEDFFPIYVRECTWISDCVLYEKVAFLVHVPNIVGMKNNWKSKRRAESFWILFFYKHVKNIVNWFGDFVSRGITHKVFDRRSLTSFHHYDIYYYISISFFSRPIWSSNFEHRRIFSYIFFWGFDVEISSNCDFRVATSFLNEVKSHSC